MNKTRLVLGRARSGTTWLANMMAAKAMYLHEPFSGIDETKRFITKWDNATGDVLGDIIGDKKGHLVIKEVRINHNAEWIAQRYPDMQIAAIIRNPFATVYSCLNFTRNMGSNPFRSLSNSTYSTIGVDDKCYYDARYTYGWLWAVENANILAANKYNNFNIVYYEELVYNAEMVLKSITHDWPFEIDDMINCEDKYNTKHEWSNPNDPEYWRDVLPNKHRKEAEKAIRSFANQMPSNDVPAGWNELMERYEINI